MSIIDPVSMKEWNIHENIGRDILKNYIKQFITGGGKIKWEGGDAEIIRFFLCDIEHDNDGSVREYFGKIGSLIIKHIE